MRNPANKQTNKQTNRHTKVIAISRFSRDNYVENFGKRDVIIFVLIDLKRGIWEDNVFVMKAITHTECTPETKSF